MASSFGQIIKINVFGESHGKFIGMTIDGLPSGIRINLNNIQKNLNLRKPDGIYSTKRIEEDKIDFISGLFDGVTVGTPLTFIIENKNLNDDDYVKGNVRPSHADYTNYIKYNGKNDYRGGGVSSGRTTVAFSVLGSICSDILKSKNIAISSHIESIHGIYDRDFNYQNIKNEISKLDNSFPVLDENISALMKKEITKASENNDSVGGTIETIIYGLDVGIGEPYFDSIESYISHLIFSIPGVKGISFGDGFDITQKFGSEVNDQMQFKNNKVVYASNHSGGINGGISNGNIINFKTAIKPTASIGKEQKSINIETKENILISSNKRHDPCIVQRAVNVINALTCYAILDLYMVNNGRKL